LGVCLVWKEMRTVGAAFSLRGLRSLSSSAREVAKYPNPGGEAGARWAAGRERTWSVTGTLPEEFRGQHFYVDVRAQNNEVLLPSVLDTVAGSTACFLLFGPRSAGKSTRVDAAVNQLREEGSVVVLRASLQGVNVSTEELFWGTLCSDIRDANPGITTPKFTSASFQVVLLPRWKRF
jgi:hypothetical protein